MRVHFFCHLDMKQQRFQLLRFYLVSQDCSVCIYLFQQRLLQSRCKGSTSVSKCLVNIYIPGPLGIIIGLRKGSISNIYQFRGKPSTARILPMRQGSMRGSEGTVTNEASPITRTNNENKLEQDVVDKPLTILKIRFGLRRKKIFPQP